MAQHNKQKKEILKNDMIVVAGFCEAINKKPLKTRLVIAWSILRGKF